MEREIYRVRETESGSYRATESDTEKGRQCQRERETGSGRVTV